MLGGGRSLGAGRNLLQVPLAEQTDDLLSTASARP